MKLEEVRRQNKIELEEVTRKKIDRIRRSYKIEEVRRQQKIE